MKPIVKQLFLFFIPTLIVALIFIVINQQNNLTTDDSEADAGIIKIESTAKNFHPATFLGAIPAQHNFVPALVAVDSILLVVATYYIATVCNVKNHSPPVNMLALNSNY